MRRARIIPRLAPLGLGVLTSFAACTDIPVQGGDFPPSGNIRGTVQYTGPLPCTAAGHVVGAAIILVFGTDLLPPPEGLGTTARSFAALPGDVLFQSVQSALPSNADGSTACPPAGSPHVTVSADWSLGPLQKGQYQIRSFYDYDGGFSPILKIHNLPTKGAVGGGALSNPLEAAAGKKPVYRTIDVDPGPNGVLIEGVAITLGKVLDTTRPIANVDSVVDERPMPGSSKVNTDPNAVVMPVDQLLSVSPTVAKNLAVADKEFVRLVLRAGTRQDEWDASVRPPLSLQAAPPYSKFHLSPNRDAAGKIVAIPEKTSPALADLFPEAIFARLDPADTTQLTPFASPAVVVQGLVTPIGGVKALLGLSNASATSVDSELVSVALRPSALCAYPLEPSKPLLLVTPSLKALNGEDVISDLNDLKGKLATRFRRDPADIVVVEGCLPPGTYAINLVYDTGQAWTIPNEAGVCQGPLETVTSDGLRCQQQGVPERALLPSQRSTIRIAGRQDVAYCDGIAAANKGDTTFKDGTPISFTAGIPNVCLTEAELKDIQALRAKMDGM